MGRATPYCAGEGGARAAVDRADRQTLAATAWRRNLFVRRRSLGQLGLRRPGLKRSLKRSDAASDAGGPPAEGQNKAHDRYTRRTRISNAFIFNTLKMMEAAGVERRGMASCQQLGLIRVAQIARTAQSPWYRYKSGAAQPSVRRRSSMMSIQRSSVRSSRAGTPTYARISSK